jgi:FAD-dependent urate hydroxylase
VEGFVQWIKIGGNMQKQTDLLIIGAGPFGLSQAAYAKHLGMDYLVVGKPMEFWKNNMPQGMYLRSASGWSLDPTDRFSIVQYLEMLGKTPKDVEPLSRDFYLAYCQWFQDGSGIETLPFYVAQLDQVNGRFNAMLENGDVIEAQKVVVAIGMGYFKNQPSELTELLPKGRYRHTVEAVQFKGLKEKRVLIIGGRQSAFEWAALLNDEGAAEVHLVHRHESPKFAEAEWEWVSPLVDSLVDNPGWFRNLPQDEKDAVNKRLWNEGRLKVEPWLEKRVMKPNTHIHAKTSLASCTERADGALDICLDNGEAFIVDDVILATGYKVDLGQIPFLTKGNLLANVTMNDGFPVLDPHFQTSVKGLYITSMPAGQDFGPFFGFTVSVRTSARIIGDAIA